MNKDQRNYLSNHIRDKYTNEKERLEKEMPEPPSLNNHIVAGLIQGTIKMKSNLEIKAALIERVSGSVNNTIVVEPERKRRRGRWDDDDDDERGDRPDDAFMSISVATLFEIPKKYLQELEKYEREKEKVKNKIATLEAQFTTIEMKVNVGSDAALQMLVDQIDEMADLKMIGAQLTVAPTILQQKILKEALSKKSLSDGRRNMPRQN